MLTLLHAVFSVFNKKGFISIVGRGPETDSSKLIHFFIFLFGFFFGSKNT